MATRRNRENALELSAFRKYEMLKIQITELGAGRGNNGTQTLRNYNYIIELSAEENCLFNKTLVTTGTTTKHHHDEDHEHQRHHQHHQHHHSQQHQQQQQQQDMGVMINNVDVCSGQTVREGCGGIGRFSDRFTTKLVQTP